jgi:hypothetical protein
VPSKTKFTSGELSFVRQGTWPNIASKDDPLGSPVTLVLYSRQTLHAILAERAAVTPEMAVRLGKFCGNGADVWLRMQVAHDVWRAERDLAETVKQIPTLHAV